MLRPIGHKCDANKIDKQQTGDMVPVFIATLRMMKHTVVFYRRESLSRPSIHTFGHDVVVGSSLRKRVYELLSIPPILKDAAIYSAVAA